MSSSGTSEKAALTDPRYNLMEKVLERNNMALALKRVEQNKGAPGIDGMKTEELRGHFTNNWPDIESKLIQGTYKPKPVKRVEIPKPGGGVRSLGIPTVLDRLIQQAILQILDPIFDPDFAQESYGFRPKRNAHQAVKRAQGYMEEGYDYVVDIDFEAFFDRVNHDVLMAKVARKVGDKRLLKLIGSYLRAGVMDQGVHVQTEEGTPQGGPLSPLLANILLDTLDRELKRRGHKFTRYADDVNVFVKSKAAGERVMESIKGFAKTRLKLKVNEEKSAVDRPQKRKFLGFTLWWKQNRPATRLSSQALKRFKNKIRILTKKSWGISIVKRIELLNSYLRGWMGYFSLIDTPSTLKILDQWIRKRLKVCLFKQWKRAKTKRRKLIGLGVPEEWAKSIAASSKSLWRLVGVSHVNYALGPKYWRKRGLLSLTDMYQVLRGIS